MRTTTKNVTTTQAMILAEHLRVIDLELVELVGTVGGLTIKAAGMLVATQRRIRELRFRIEVECGVDGTRGAPPGVVHDFQPLAGTGAGSTAR